MQTTVCLSLAAIPHQEIADGTQQFDKRVRMIIECTISNKIKIGLWIWDAPPYIEHPTDAGETVDC